MNDPNVLIAFFMLMATIGGAILGIILYLLQRPHEQAKMMTMMTQTFTNLFTQVVRLTDIIDKRDERLDRLEEEIRKLKAERDELRRLVDNLTREGAQKEVAINGLRQRIGALEESEAAAKRLVENKDKEIISLKAHIRELDTRIKNLEAERDSVRAQMVEAQAIATNLRTELESIKHAAESTKPDISELPEPKPPTEPQKPSENINPILVLTALSEAVVKAPKEGNDEKTNG